MTRRNQKNKQFNNTFDILQDFRNLVVSVTTHHKEWLYTQEYCTNISQVASNLLASNYDLNTKFWYLKNQGVNDVEGIYIGLVGSILFPQY